MSTSLHPDPGPDSVADAHPHGDPSADPSRAARSLQGLADAPPISLRRRRPGRRAKWARRILALAVCLSAGVALAVYYEPLMQRLHSLMGSQDAGALANIQTYTARRGELRITLVEEGKLRAVKNHTIRMGTSGVITWLAEAGAKVKKGDRLATLDTKQIEDQIHTWESDLENQSKQKENAEKAIPIAKTAGDAKIGNAETALAAAKLALKQYTTLDAPKKLNDMENAVNDARTKLAEQQKKTRDIQTQLDDMLDEGDAKKTIESNLALARQSEATLKRGVDTAEDQRKLYRSYTYTQDMATKQRAVANAELAVVEAKVTAANDVLAKEGEVNRYKSSMNNIQNNINRYKTNIERSTATAPADGLVFYGGSDLERYGMSDDSIKVGAQVWSDMTIMSIPDLSAFLVNFPVAEVYRGRVSTGMSATITIDAVPGLVMNGKLTTVSSVSRNKVQYDSSSPPVYDATLSLDVADPRMVAGMTVQVEIVTASLKDVIFVPVEAVFNEEGKTAVFLWVDPDPKDPKKARIEKHPVYIGQASDHFVQILGGVAEGDKLLLSRPTSFITPTNYRELADALAALAAAASSAAAPGTIKTEFTPASGSAADRGMIRTNPDGSVSLISPSVLTPPASTSSAPASAVAPTSSLAPASRPTPLTAALSRPAQSAP